jgi:hypothetical protein
VGSPTQPPIDQMPASCFPSTCEALIFLAAMHTSKQVSAVRCVEEIADAPFTFWKLIATTKA